MADAWSLLGLFGVGLRAPRVAYPEARNAAEQALALDEHLGEAHSALAVTSLNFDWNWPKAEAEFKRAIELNPNFPSLYHWYSHLLTATGRTKESLSMSLRGLELDPYDLTLNAHLIWYYIHAGAFDEAVARARQTLEMDDRFVSTYLYGGIAFEQAGRLDDAIRTLERGASLSSDGRTYVMRAALGHAYALAGRRSDAERVLATLLETRRTAYVAAYTIALLVSALGRDDEAFQWLHRAVDERDNWLVYANVDPRLRNLRQDPRFVEILEGVGLDRNGRSQATRD
jgi:tetratricopeptide (TPR) repeat protein